MPLNPVDEVPRPPGRRSIQLYGPPPVQSPPTGPSARLGALPTKSTALTPNMPGIASLNSTTVLHRPGNQQAYFPTSSVLSQHSLASTVPRRRISSASSVTAAGGHGSEAAVAAAADGAAAGSAASPRHLRGRLNEGTVHRALQFSTPLPNPVHAGTRASAASLASPPPLPQPPSAPSTASQLRAGSRGKGVKYGPSVVSWVQVAGDGAMGAFPAHNRNSNHDTHNESSDAASHPATHSLHSNNVSSSHNRAGSPSQPWTLRGGGSSNSNSGNPASASPAAAAAMAQMVNEAALRNTWAMRFTDTAALRQAVSTDGDACTGTEEALVAELNTLRQAPAAYAAVVEREATVGAPYVRPEDTYLASEAAAEEAAVALRRRIEVEAAQEVAAAAVAAAGGGASSHPHGPASGTSAAAATSNRLQAASFNASNVSPKLASTAYNTPPSAALSINTSTTAVSAASPILPTNTTERKKGKKGKSTTPSTSTGTAAVTVSSPAASSKEVSTASNAGAESKDTSFKSRGTEVHRTPERQRQAPLGPANDNSSPSSQRLPDNRAMESEAITAQGPQALTLAELRHQLRCQQRYRAALETTLKELRMAQRQAEAAQLAAWAAEDEKAQKRARRSTANTASATVATTGLGSPGYSASGVGGAGQSATSFVKKLSTASSARRGSPAMEETVFVRRSEEAAQIHRAYEVRVHRVDQELRRARSVCRRSLAGGNLIASAVRALRAARPVAPLRRSRGLSLAARDTAEIYYGDEERVAALRGLYALSRTTLVGLGEPTGHPPQQAQQQVVRGVTDSSKSLGTAMSTNTLEGLSRQRDEGTMEGLDADMTSPPGVLPVLSEEALLLAQVAQQACTTYGYISNEVRGVHLQGAGSPRTLMLQLIVGCLTPVLDIAHQPTRAGDAPVNSYTSTDAGKAATGQETAMRCYAGVRLEGKVYAAYPDVSSNNNSSQDALTAPVQMDDDVCADVFNSTSERGGPYGGGAAGSNDNIDDDALRRLWPLLWPGASAVGCGWQQVRGWRHVPTYAEAQQRIAAEQQALALLTTSEQAGVLRESNGTSHALSSHAAAIASPLVQGGETAVVCSTLLLASGFEEYEVGRACVGMSPAATRRVIQELSNPEEEGAGAEAAFTASSTREAHEGGVLAVAATSTTRGRAAGDARRAAVEVHSSLGVTLLTPTMHPVIVSASAASPYADISNPGPCNNGAVVCVAVRVPAGGEQDLSVHGAQATAASARVEDADTLPPSIRVVAQVTKQSDPVPSSPSVDAAVVLSQRSPVDPSVWLVLVNAAAAFAQHCGAASSLNDSNSNSNIAKGISRGSTGAMGGSSDDGIAVPLALHLFAKDVRDATAGYEHVAFIRLKRSAADEAHCQRSNDQTSSSLLIAPEWRYLLKGLSGFPESSTAFASTSNVSRPAFGSSAPHCSGRELTPSSAAHTAGGWAMLHEPLLGREGVVLYPLSANFRASDVSTPQGTEEVKTAHGAASSLTHYASASVMSAIEPPSKFTPTVLAAGVGGGRVSGDEENTIHVAVQLPAHANLLWWARRLTALHAARDALAAEVKVEEEEENERERKGAAESKDTQTEQGKGEAGNDSNKTNVQDAAGNSNDLTSHEQNATAAAETPNGALAATSKPGTSNVISSPTPPTPPPPPSSSSATTGGRLAVANDKSSNNGKKKSTGGRAGSKGASKERGGGEGAGEGTTPESKGAKGNTKTSSRLGGGANSTSPSFVVTEPGTGKVTSASFSGLSGLQRRTLSFYMTVDSPESAALRDYEALRSNSTPPTASPSASAIGVPPHLQAAQLSLSTLRSLHQRLRDDAQVWQAHLARIQPLLDSERERIAAEAGKKKGKEQQRLQHDQDDVAKEMAEMQRRVDVFDQAIRATWEALRKRERAQVLRTARLTRVTSELAALQAAMMTATAGKGAYPHTNKMTDNIHTSNGSDTSIAATMTRAAAAPSGAIALAGPRVTLRLFDKAAVAAGSGRNVAAAAAAAAASTAASTVSQGQINVLDFTTGVEEDRDAQEAGPECAGSTRVGECAAGGRAEGGGIVAPAAENVVVLQPHPVNTLPKGPHPPAVVYAATCTIPPNFTGQATLLIDDEVAVTWSL